MSAHEYASGGASWNPAFRPDSHSSHVQNQPEPPVIVPEEVINAPAVERHVARDDVDDFYTQHSSVSDEHAFAQPASPQQVNEAASQTADKQPEHSRGYSHPANSTAQLESEEQLLDTEEEVTMEDLGKAHEIEVVPELEQSEVQQLEVQAPEEHKFVVQDPEVQEIAMQEHGIRAPDVQEHEAQELRVQEEQSPLESPAMIPEPTLDLLDDARQTPLEVTELDEQPTLRDMPEQSATPEHVTVPANEEALEIQRVGYEYEYQGESTAADDAVDESVQAPLLEDEEVMPTSEERPAPPQRPSEALAESIQRPGPEPNQAEAAPQDIAEAFGWADEETDDTFDALGIQTQPDQQQTFDEPQQDAAFWGDAEADDTFETLATQAQPEQPLHDMDPSPHRRSIVQDGPVAASRATALEEVLRENTKDEEPSKAQEDDLAAMWSAALADDEFLDDSASVDPSAFFADDGEGFLDDFDATQPDLASPTQPMPVVNAHGQTVGFTAAGHASAQAASRYTPLVQEQPRQRIPNPLTSPEFFSSSRMPALAATAPAVYGGYNQTPHAATSQSPQVQQRPTGPQSSQSFVDKSKGGYASPYDLPDSIVQPRSRPARPAAAPVVQPNAPPPRTSSMTTAPPPLARAPTAASLATPSPPMSGQPFQSQPQSQSQLPRSSTASDKKDLSGGFFADLPVIPKARVRPSGTYTPSPALSTQSPPQLPPMRAGTMPPPSGPPLGAATQIFGGLQPPDRLPLLPDVAPTAPQQLQPPPVAPPPSTRYSPVAPASGAALVPGPAAAAARFSPAPPSAPPAASSRYSPAPPSQPSQPQGQAQNKYSAAPQGPRPGMPFAPRTSSPLAFAEKPHLEAPGAPVRSLSYQPGSASVIAPKPATSMGPPSRRGSEQQVEYGAPLQPMQSRSYAPSNQSDGHHNSVASPPRMTPYAPSIPGSPESRKSQPFTPVDQSSPYDHFSPSARPRTQSPGAVMKGPLRTATQFDPPTTASDVTSPTMIHQQDTRQKLHPARRQFSADLSFTVPQDERAADGLERWKGSPILRWSPSGTLVTSFPKQAPFYATGHAIPTIKCTPGPITIHDSKTTFPMDERNAKFPGPFSLKGKGKKKELSAWLTTKIEDLSKAHEEEALNYNTPQLLKRRVEEKVILWKIAKLFLEHDNKVEGNTPAEVEARNILLPELAQNVESAEISPADSMLKSEPVSADALAQIRKRLLDGKREDAVWYAAEQRLWSHALLIASVGGPGLWKQVVQEFVRAQVKDAGEKAQSLAALYEVFAGNWDESIDELVPPSARAGFQMINKSGPSAKNPLDGLDQWRETLSLIISNRSTNDVQAIVALGRLLSKYGRVEAAHTCYLFARASAKWAGADDLEADFVLLGADHQSQPHELAIDLDSILLSETYEYLLSIAPAAGASPVVPHLQAYKLHHAHTLAEHGLRKEAQSYCDAIEKAVKSSTRASPYYHTGLLSQVEELNRCLSAAPQPTGSSWIPKPSMDKVSGSMWKRFNTFVAGDDDDQASNGTGPGSESGQTAGPFGKVTGDSPTMSRQGSSADLYSAMSMNGGPASSMMSTSAPSKYAPINAAMSRTPLEHTVSGRYAPHASNTYSPRGSLESTRSEIPERPGTGYSMYTGLQPQPPQPRSSSTPFGAYLPQGQNVSDAQHAQQLGVPRPEAARAVSDYRVQYSQPASRRESVQSGSASVSGYSPRPSLEQSRYSPRPPMEHDQPTYGYQPQAAQDPSPYQPGGSYTSSMPENIMESIEEPDPEGQGYPPSAPQEFTPTHEPSRPPFERSQSSYEPPSTTYEPPSSSFDHAEAGPSDEPVNSYEPPTSYAPTTSSYTPTDSYEPPASYEPSSSSYQPYEPPSSSYQPYQPEPDPEDQPSEESEPLPKKKSIMDLSDDEDDMVARAAALKAQQKRDADRAADEAFRAAAEADAKRDSPSSQTGKKGWFGGWFKKGEAGNLDAAAAGGNKPIRAKLGEENSFYYDPDLKKWVNKKGGATPEASTPTPPPPRAGPPGRSAGPSGMGGPPITSSSGPPSRVASASGGPPSGPPSRGGTPGLGGAPAMSPPGGVASAVPPGLASGPPSRPATSMSNASSIDDLLGAPAPRKGAAGAKKGKRGGRYVDVMAK